MDDVTAKVDDQEIALLMMDGDEEGLRMLLKKYGAKTLAILRKQLGHTVLSPTDLEDALYDAAWKAYRAANQFDDRNGKLSGWFYRITYHCAIDILRVEESHRHEELHENIDHAAPSSSKTELSRTTLKALRAAVEKLPGRQKQVILSDLAVHGEASDTELASRLGTTVNTVRVSRHRAKLKLKTALEKMGLYQS